MIVFTSPPENAGFQIPRFGRQKTHPRFHFRSVKTRVRLGLFNGLEWQCALQVRLYTRVLFLVAQLDLLEILRKQRHHDHVQ